MQHWHNFQDRARNIPLHNPVTGGRIVRLGDHPNSWIPEQKISVAEAVRCLLHAQRRVCRICRKRKRQFQVGKLADFAMLPDDVFTIMPEKIHEGKRFLNYFGDILFTF